MKKTKLHFFYLLLFIELFFFFTNCSTTGQMGTVFTATTSPMETDTKPQAIFTDKKFSSISIMNFDAKGVKTYRGMILDYVSLGDNLTDDLIRAFYETGHIRVTIGEHIDEVTVTDKVMRSIGDENTKKTEINRSVKYKAAPFRKVDAILEGRVLRFNKESTFEKSFIEIYFKLTDTYDGSVYWITKMRGRVNNVIGTIVESVSTGSYSEVIKGQENTGGETDADAN